eukprot:685356-Amorphochlora_amoeboformis.AAC.1
MCTCTWPSTQGKTGHNPDKDEKHKPTGVGWGVWVSKARPLVGREGGEEKQTLFGGARDTRD